MAVIIGHSLGGHETKRAGEGGGRREQSSKRKGKNNNHIYNFINVYITFMGLYKIMYATICIKKCL